MSLRRPSFHKGNKYTEGHKKLRDPMGVGGHQNMPTGFTLGPATRVRILVPIGANAFDSIAGQTDNQTDRKDHILNYSIDLITCLPLSTFSGLNMVFITG